MTQIKRNTKETKVDLSLNIYGSGKYDISTGIGFFDHMLEAFCKHSLVDLNIKCIGDTYIDFHHSVEDVGIVLGKALRDEIYPIKNIERFSDATVVMDEACVKSSMDLSNRAYLVYDVPMSGKIGDFDTELTEEFFRALVSNASINLHIIKERGKNKHHLVEATFKSFAISLRRALKENQKTGIPSTKGTL